MNTVLSMPQGLGTVNVAGMLALPGYKFKSSRIANNLPVNTDRLIHNIFDMLDLLVTQAIDARTSEAFVAVCDKVLPQYYSSLLGFSYLLQIPRDLLGVMNDESFSNIEAGFRDKGLATFGSDIRDQAVFTVWTLRKIGNLCQRIDRIPLNPELKESNSDLLRQFLFHAVLTQFSLHCLTQSMLLQKPIYPEVMPIIMDGLRNSVNAYTYARRALSLRDSTCDVSVTPVEWDEEDAQLLEEASHDLVEALD